METSLRDKVITCITMIIIVSFFVGFVGLLIFSDVKMQKIAKAERGIGYRNGYKACIYDIQVVYTITDLSFIWFKYQDRTKNWEYKTIEELDEKIAKEIAKEIGDED